MRETPSVVPDRIEPVVAYRAWLREVNFLNSFGWSQEVWKPRITYIAKHIPNRMFIDIDDKQPVHNISNCTSTMFQCGIYGIKTYKYFTNEYHQDIRLICSLICGQVYLWGLIIEHELGYRAEYAYPKCLYLDGKKDDTIRMIASNYRISAVEPPAMEPQLHFNSLVDLQRDTNRWKSVTPALAYKSLNLLAAL